MEFYIKKNATLPILKVEICKDGRSDFNLNDFLDSNYSFYISLFDKSTDKILFASKECNVTTEVSPFEYKTLYFLNYQFTNKDTLKTGKYEVQISVTTDNGVIILPLQEKFYVNILDSFTADNSSFLDSYSLNLPCCGFQETFEVGGLSLEAYYYSGSVIVDYILTSTQTYNKDIRVNFTNFLNVFTGSPIEIVTGVTISGGQNRGITQIIYQDFNFANLTQVSIFNNVEFTESVQNTVLNFENNVIFNTPPPSLTPTQTPTMTQTPSQTITQTPTMSLTPTQTPTMTPTQTPTMTPTQTPTETPTMTPTVTPTQTLTQSPSPSLLTCNCYNFFNTGTTGNGTIDYISCGGVLQQSIVPPGDYGQVCLRGSSFTATSQIGVSYLVGDCSLGSCPSITANTCNVFVINNQNRIIYLYDSDTNTQIPLPISLSSTTPYDIATNDNLLWVFGVFPGNVTGIKEFTISRNPFTATLNRFITVGTSLFPSAQNGLAVVNNTTLLVASGATGTQISSLDITTTAATATLLFNLPSQRGLRGDLVYTNTGKIIASTYNIVTLSDSRLQQYDYSGTTEVDFSIGNAGNGFAFYVHNSEFYTVLCGTSSASRGKRSLTSPYGNTALSAMTISNVGMAQPLSCYNINFT